MNIGDETLIAYVDGELPADQIRAVEAALRRSPRAQAFVDRQRRLRHDLAQSFAAADGEVPERLLHAIAKTPVSATWRFRRIGAGVVRLLTDRRVFLWTGLPTATALACGLAIGILASPAGMLTIAPSGQMLAQGRLSRALNTQLASAQPSDASIRVGLSFKAKDGRYCRTFSSSAQMAGVACRDSAGWVVATLAAASDDDGRMAGSSMPEAIRKTVSTLIAGEPFDAQAERRARDAGWRTH